MRLRVNLSLNPLERHRRFKVLLGGLGGLGALMFLALGWHVFQFRKADAAFRIQRENSAREIDQLRVQRQELDVFFLRPENAKLHDNADFVNTIVDARSFNWTRMFMALEKVLPEGVRVLSIEPKQVGGQAAVKMTVNAASEDAKVKFLNALEQSGAFSHLQLASVHVNDQGAGGGQLILEITVIYSRT
jgi:type IV pilus assembly protein PilN